MPKVKISISVDANVVSAVDRSAKSEGETRSAVIERWLQQASRRSQTIRLEADTAAYYDGLSAEEREENTAWAAASSRAFRRGSHTVKRRAPRRRRA